MDDAYNKKGRISLSYGTRRRVIAAAWVVIGYIIGAFVFSPDLLGKFKLLCYLYFFPLDRGAVYVLAALFLTLLPAFLLHFSAYSELGHVWRSLTLAAAAFFAGNKAVTLFYLIYNGDADFGGVMFSAAVLLCEAVMLLFLISNFSIAADFHESTKKCAVELRAPVSLFSGAAARRYMFDAVFLIAVRAAAFFAEGLLNMAYRV